MPFNKEDFMLNFLTRNYPITRLKYQNKFRRGIKLDNGNIHLLKNTELNLRLQVDLISILEIIFNYDHKTNVSVVKTYLNLK